MGGGNNKTSHEEVAERAGICTQREDIANESLQQGEGFGRKVTFREVIKQIREKTKDSSQVEKGTLFEILMCRFFQYEPTYKDRFSDVWLWRNWPYRNGKHDIGIDIVAKERATDRYVAIQCKFYDNEVLYTKAVDTFFAALNMEWDTDNGPGDTFARGIIVATCYSTSKNLKAINTEQKIPCSFIGLAELESYEEIDWGALKRGQAYAIRKNELRKPHQEDAVKAVVEAFRNGTERGKLIMACGTGKTFTSLRLTEEYTGGKGCVLFLAPSIALVSQSLREWMNQTNCKMHPIAVCSDSSASDIDENYDLAAANLPSPATTDPEEIARNYQRFKDTHLTVIFSTYHSLRKVCEAQVAHSLPEFDLTICDEAHRTAGPSFLVNGERTETDFRRVHDQKELKSKRRLYMTATPKVYGDALHERAKHTERVVLADMNDESLFGKELYSLPFSRAVKDNLLTDYKVLVLCVDESYVKDLMGSQLKHGGDGQFELEDAVKLVGCYNGLRKKMLSPRDDFMSDKSSASEKEDDEQRKEFFNRQREHTNDLLCCDHKPMRRAVAFSGKIKISEAYAELWKHVVKTIKENECTDTPFDSEMHHVDGNMDMNARERELLWLKDEESTECRVLTNAKCLSEGVDVPSLDAVMFLAPKKSQIDIVQSIGRVMRKDPSGEKQFGYVIIPVCIPSWADDDDKVEDVLDDDKRFKVVWQVLQALRAHDDRFDAEIKTLELNKYRELKHGSDDGGSAERVIVAGNIEQGTFDQLLSFTKKVRQVKDAVFARMVSRVGTRYWESWVKDIADIAERHRQAIANLIQQPDCSPRFQEFKKGLKENIREKIEDEDVVEMLAMQFVSRPVFNALFGEYEFADKNPVSITMNAMLDFIEQRIGSEDNKTLRRFYEDVKTRAGGITTTEGRQRVIKELYGSFFKTAFKKIADALGIVYTPVEIVDFILQSVHSVLQKEFNIADGLSAEGVRILDPFTGTGTFIVRAIQSGLIKKEDLPRKYEKELFASEIVLLAYYIACVNIEVAYHGEMKQADYAPFSGICFTDTFRMRENSAKSKELLLEFEDNGKRVENLCKQDIRVIIGNPPYSAGQKSANDNNQNAKYPELDQKIAETYVAQSTATRKSNLYDSYIRAFRWASDRITDDGIISYITNSSYIDGVVMAGFRKCLMNEFSSIYCFNLRGATLGRKGDALKKEGDNVFDIRTGVAIILLIKKKNRVAGKQATLHYYDIGDYLSRKDKFRIIQDFGDFTAIPWQILTPDEHGDWINHRTEGYERFMPIGDKKAKGKGTAKALFDIFSNGVKTNRDAWCYSYSLPVLERNIKRSIEFFNTQSVEYRGHSDISVKDFIEFDKKIFSWDRQQITDVALGKQYTYNAQSVRVASYRSFIKQHLYFNRSLNNCVYQMPKLFPTPKHENLVITIPGVGGGKAFSCLIHDVIVDLNSQDAGAQCFPLYWYEKRADREGMLELGLEEAKSDYIRRDGITDWGHKEFKQAYADPKISKEDIFYYVYGLLHSEEYRTRFKNNLKKELPRIPFSKDFWGFSKAGRKLAELHLNYETVEPYPLEEEHTGGDYRIEDKMRFPQKGEKDAIIYNSTTILRGIPEEAYEYIVNGQSAIEWIMERYAVTPDKKKSGIVNDPNDWCTEHNNPRYIIDLIKRIVTVSVETVKITRSLPKLEEL